MPDRLSYEEFEKEYLSKYGIASMLDTPLRVGDRFAGSFAVSTLASRDIGPTRIDILSCRWLIWRR